MGNPWIFKQIQYYLEKGEKLAKPSNKEKYEILKEHIELDIKYKGILLDKKYIADFICYEKIIIEIKALTELSSTHQAQVINYLKATNLKLGLLVNFNTSEINENIIRIVNHL